MPLTLPTISLALALSLNPIVRARALDMLRSRFDSEAEIGELDVSLWHGIVVSGKHLVVRHHGRTDVPPLLEIAEFSGEMGWFALIDKPWRIRHVELKARALRVVERHLWRQERVRRRFRSARSLG